MLFDGIVKKSDKKHSTLGRLNIQADFGCVTLIEQESMSIFVVGEAVTPGPEKRHGVGSTAGRNC
jgi:hypothetical protein